MAAKLAIALPLSGIEAFCQRWNITEFAVFGTVLREDFRPDSDIDVLFTLGPQARVGLMELFEMREELQALFGRNVDLVSRRAIERSQNRLRRENILGSAQVIYAA